MDGLCGIRRGTEEGLSLGRGHPAPSMGGAGLAKRCAVIAMCGSAPAPSSLCSGAGLWLDEGVEWCGEMAAEACHPPGRLEWVEPTAQHTGRAWQAVRLAPCTFVSRPPPCVQRRFVKARTFRGRRVPALCQPGERPWQREEAPMQALPPHREERSRMPGSLTAGGEGGGNERRWSRSAGWGRCQTWTQEPLMNCGSEA